MMGNPNGRITFELESSEAAASLGSFRDDHGAEMPQMGAIGIRAVQAEVRVWVRGAAYTGNGGTLNLSPGDARRIAAALLVHAEQAEQPGRCNPDEGAHARQALGLLMGPDQLAANRRLHLFMTGSGE